MSLIKSVQNPDFKSWVVGKTSASKALKPFRPANRHSQRTLLRARAVEKNELSVLEIKEAQLIKMIQEVANPIAAAMDGGADLSKRSLIDEFIVQMESNSPESEPLSSESRHRLLGTWALIYASSGTVVTRSLIGRALSLLAKLPYVGISDIVQTLMERNGESEMLHFVCEERIES